MRNSTAGTEGTAFIVKKENLFFSNETGKVRREEDISQ